MEYEQIKERIDSALSSIFNEDGKRAVLYYMTEKYRLTLEQASRDPRRLENALTNLLGEIGWIVVKRRILERVYGQLERGDFMTVKSISLNAVFGQMGGLTRSLFLFKHPL